MSAWLTLWILAAPLGLDECIARALEHNPEVHAAQADLALADAERKSARGVLGPRLRAEASILRWDGPQETAFSLPGSTTMLPPFQVRDAVTGSVTVSVIQPLTPLIPLYELMKIKELGVDVARVRRAVARRDLAFQTAEAYYRLLQAQQLAEIAASSVANVESQLERSRSFERQGVVGRNDVLRVEVGVAQARQRLVQARGGVSLATARLATLIGLPSDQPLEVRPAPGEPPPPEVVPVATLEQRALERRIELTEIEARIQQARRGVTASKWRLGPTVSVIGSYQHNRGSLFQQRDAFYVGGFLQWDLFEWGALWYGVEEADVRTRQALVARERIRDGLRLEARSAAVQRDTAAEALGVAKKAVAAAEESFRIESRRYQASAATSFDVLESETQLTSARGQLTTATYDYLIARAALARALGETCASCSGP